MSKLILSLLITVVFIFIANTDFWLATKPQAGKNDKVQVIKQSNYVQVARFIKSKEAFRSKAYKCSAGKLTIGYGHVIRSGESLTSITKHQADSIFLIDFEKAYKSVRKLGISNPDSARVLASFTFNCGIEATKKVVRSGNLSNIKKYCYAKGKRLKGLMIRRNQEFSMLKSPQYVAIN